MQALCICGQFDNTASTSRSARRSTPADRPELVCFESLSHHPAIGDQVRTDSLLERSGFEPSVPLVKLSLVDYPPLTLCWRKKDSDLGLPEGRRFRCGPFAHPENGSQELIAQERQCSPSYGGRSVFGWEHSDGR